MALFGIRKKEETKEEKTSKEGEPEVLTKKDSVSEKKRPSSVNRKSEPSKGKRTLSADTNLSEILLRPRITEKATFASEKGVYVFEVSGRATKRTIRKAIEQFYKVTPLKVNIVKIPAKVRISKWRKARGVKPGGKKAYVHLKEGDRIEIV